MTKKLICLIITIAMVLTMMPAMAVAANTAGLENFKKVQTYKDGQFTDVKAKDWFAENVEASYELNLMVGKSGNFFDTESNLTVAEAMTIAARLREIYYTGKAEFKQGQPWYKVYTDYCKENKIADPTDYDLNKAITRGQFAEIFSKAFPTEALKKINNVQDNMIPDVKTTDKFSEAIYLLYRAGILTGNDSKGTFASDTNIRRIEAAAITTRMAQPALRKSITLVKQSSGGNYTPRYTITFDVNGHGTAPAEQTIRYGNKITKPANPTEAGYTFNAWYKEKECINEWKFATDTVTKDTTLYAKWTINSYNVNAQVQGDHGTATVKVNDVEVSSAEYASNVVFSATPNDGYEFDHWEVVSGGIDIESVKNNAEINVTMPATALTLKAHFKAAVPATYNIIVEDDGHGTARAQVGGEDVSSAAPNATVTLVATANDGYAFKEWQIARGLEASGITDNSFTMPSNEVKVKAIFERVYNITLQTNEHGKASATVGGETATTAAENAEVTLTATPDEGYQFKEWKTVSGGVTISDADKVKSELTFTMPASNVTVQAVFEAKSQGCQYGDKGLGYAMCSIKQERIFYAYYEYTDSQYFSPIFNILNGDYLPGITVGDYFHLVGDSIVPCNDGHGIELCKVTLAFDDTKGTTKFEQKEFYVPKGTGYSFNVDDSELVIEGWGYRYYS